MSVYLQLLATAMVPVLFSVIFYFLKSKTAFEKLPYWAQQIIIGVIFGGVAVIGTECGVKMDGAVINARDAGPLCAGLLFGAPAGIIAGIIGGVERWFAALWGAGMYSRVACSVSTILAGFYAAVLRKHMFDDKRPTVGFGFFIGIVMEVVHLSILFVTHLSDAAAAYEIVKVTTFPMLLCNAVAVALAILLLNIFGHNVNRGDHHIGTIAQKVQSRMLLCVVLAYLATTAFVYILQTNTALTQAESLLSINLSDVQTDINDATDAKLLEKARSIANAYDKGEHISLNILCNQYGVSEVNVIDANGIITESTNSDYIGFDMHSGAQAAEFLPLLDGTVKEYVQEYQKITYDDSECKYAACSLHHGGMVQIAYNAALLEQDISSSVYGITRNRHLGESGYMIVADRSGRIVSDQKGHLGRTLDETGIVFWPDMKENTRMEGKVYGENSYWMYALAGTYRIISVMPTKEVFATRDAASYVNSYMEVMVFAALFALIYMLIKRLVVNNIRSVNANLEQIIGGNLSVTVDVRTSSEFSSLSDDINSTVTTLKHYIDEAAARIDKELEFARNIQSSALPSTFPAFPDENRFDIYASMHTAKEVGGDFYDFYRINDNKVAFLVADVSGKGIPAAMFMMRSKTLIKSLAERGLAVNEVFTYANNTLCEENDAGMFVTAWMGILDLRTGHVEFANAGHNPPLIYRADGSYTYLRSRAGLVLAGMEGINYKLQEFDLAKGDRIFLYTDGVTEATDPDKQLYGEERLQAFLDAHQKDALQDVLSELKTDIDAFAGEAEQFDDITMVILDYEGSEKEMTERIFPAKTEALNDVTAFLEEEMEKAGCSPKMMMQMSVALEEIFVNIAHYAYGEGEGDMTLGISTQGGEVTVQFTDSGEPFDPLKKPDPDVSLSASERSIGGLGIYMVKKTMDDMSYVYRDGKNILTIVKKIG